jgi:DNA-binding CsgD family transcriptional regulator
MDSMPKAVERLSERQKQCLRLVYERHTSKEIGRHLGLSFDTVDQHVKRAMQILGSSSRGEAARTLIAHESGHPQLLVTQPEGVADRIPELPSPLQANGAASVFKTLLSALFGLPAVGGEENDLSAKARLAHILRIGFVSAVMLFAILVIATGSISLLKLISN